MRDSSLDVGFVCFLIELDLEIFYGSKNGKWNASWSTVITTHMTKGASWNVARQDLLYGDMDL